MVKVIDWEERYWNLTHDITVRLAIENYETEKQMSDAVVSAVGLAAATCAGYRELFGIKPSSAEGGK